MGQVKPASMSFFAPNRSDINAQRMLYCMVHNSEKIVACVITETVGRYQV